MIELRSNTVVHSALFTILITFIPAVSRSIEPPKVDRSAVPAGNPVARPYEVGRATWYGTRFHGRVTASGESFDMFRLTAAHPQLPMGSVVKVTALRSGRSVVVQITDRGPNRTVRQGKAIIDLSYAAAKALKVLKSGGVRVRLDLLSKPRTLEVARR